MLRSASLAVVAAAAASAQQCGNSNGPTPHLVSLGGRSDGSVEFNYGIQGDSIVAKAVFSQQWKGWVSVAFSGEPKEMDPSNAFIGDVNTGKVTEYFMSSTKESGVRPAETQKNLLSGNVTKEGGKTVLYFTRKLLPNADDEYVTISDRANLIWAAGDGNLGFHDRNYGSGGGVLGECAKNAENSVATTTKPPTASPSAAEPKPSASAVEGSCASNDAEYPYMAKVDEEVTVYWKSEGNSVNFKAVLATAVNGWFSLGMAKETDSMFPATAFIGTVGNGQVSEYVLSSEADAGVNRAASQNGISKSAISVQDGKTVLTFTRALSDPNTYINLNGTTNFIWAYGAGTLGNHMGNRGHQDINMAECGKSTPAPTATGSASLTPSVTPTASTDKFVGGMVYANQASLGSNVKASWQIVGDVLKAQFVLERKAGWFSVGFSGRSGKMYPATAVIGDVTTGKVRDYHLTGESDSTVQPKADQNALSAGNVSYSTVDGKTVLFFERKISAEDHIKTTEDTNLIWAYGNGALANHGPNFGSASANLARGSTNGVEEGDDKTAKLVVVHGVLMALAWAVLSPVAIMMARFKPFVSERCSTPLLWFKSHWVLQLLAVLLSTAGLVVGVKMVEEFEAEPHQIMGVCVLAMTFAQPLLSIKRPHPKEEDGTVSTLRKVWSFVHKNNGRCAVLLAFVTCGFGLKEADAASWVFYLYYAWCAVVAILYLGGSYKLWRHENAQREEGAQNVPGANYMAGSTPVESVDGVEVGYGRGPADGKTKGAPAY